MNFEDILKLSNHATTATTSAPTTINLERMLETLEKIPPCPFARFMLSKGFAPSTSTLWLPEAMRKEVPFPPSYVRFSIVIDVPVICLNLDARVDYRKQWLDLHLTKPYEAPT